ncbi:efflux RND transporter permease subunit, partial [Dehalococcoidia bacterium]|nr:efflux RND transporter permease subunit [Dehalococcoidia bacterium]
EVEFPLVTITTFYPSANPETVVSDVTAPIEDAIAGIDGLESIQSRSSEIRSIIFASFEFGTDMEKAEEVINANIKGLQFPKEISGPLIGRVNPNSFPVLRISVTGERGLIQIQEVVESKILPEIESVNGVSMLEVTGDVQQQVSVTVNPEKMLDRNVSLNQISQVLRGNNYTLPGGSIYTDGRVIPIKTTNSYESLDELRKLVIASPQTPMGDTGSPAINRGILTTLGDVANIQLGTTRATSISRTNGKSSLGIAVIKEPDANTIDVTTNVMAAVQNISDLPYDIDIVTISNDGPEIQAQIDTLEREALIGLVLAVSVVFVFFLTLRPTAIRGAFATLRPTLVIGLSIPLSILTGVLLMSWQDLTLNFMTLGGLAISVGRVVDDSIVVLENIYRNIQYGKERWRAALDATTEVGPAIITSTLTTIVVFVPLGFIQGLVGAFFLPFAMTVSFALIASLLVALTAVPVLGAYLLRPGDMTEITGKEKDISQSQTILQRMYLPVLNWALNHKAITLVTAIVITLASLSLTLIIPVNLFPSGGDRFITIDMSLQPGTPAETTLQEVAAIEDQVKEYSDVYVTTVGSPASAFGVEGPSGDNQSITFVRLKENAPANITHTLRNSLVNLSGHTIKVSDVNAGGPPTAGLDINIKGTSYAQISSATKQLLEELRTIDGVEDITSDVTEARDEIVVNVDPSLAASIGLSTQQVAFQLNQYLVGQQVTQVKVNNSPVDVVLRGQSNDINSIEKVGMLTIAGPIGTALLNEIALLKIQDGPISISRTDGLRSAAISGRITADDTRAVGERIQEKIDSIKRPPGLKISSGGVFQQIAEGFQDIFISMAIGIVLVYLVMVASLGSLRNPFVIVSSLPLALIGALVALAITGRSLGLPAMMGILLLIGIVVTNAIVLISFVEQLRKKDLSVYDALIHGGRTRLRPILMTAITTSIALLPLAMFSENDGGIIGAELATVVIGGLISSTLLTLIVVPVVYTLGNQSIPDLIHRLTTRE